jgi:hypothetical protein
MTASIPFRTGKVVVATVSRNTFANITLAEFDVLSVTPSGDYASVTYRSTGGTVTVRTSDWRILEEVGDMATHVVEMTCPNCLRVRRVARIPSDAPEPQQSVICAPCREVKC